MACMDMARMDMLHMDTAHMDKAHMDAVRHTEEAVACTAEELAPDR